MIHDTIWTEKFHSYLQSTFEFLNLFSKDQSKWKPCEVDSLLKDRNGVFYVFLTEFFDSCLIDAEVSWDEEQSGNNDSFYKIIASRKKDKEQNRDRFSLIVHNTLLMSMFHYNKRFADDAKYLIDSNKSIPIFLFYLYDSVMNDVRNDIILGKHIFIAPEIKDERNKELDNDTSFQVEYTLGKTKS